MALARALEYHEDAVRADFQQFYGLDIDRMGRDYSTLHAAALLSQLPEGSRFHIAIDHDAVWTPDRLLAAAMVNDLNWLVWSKTKDGEKGRKRPKPIGPAKTRGEKRIKGIPMQPERLLAEIKRIREAVADG